jgi:hypothetical protein
VAPNYRLCSLPGCEETPVAAIRRGPSGPRPPYWQPYCRGHAGDRGIKQTPADLDWMPGFLTERPVRRSARR